jgi:hypothetical protein
MRCVGQLSAAHNVFYYGSPAFRGRGCPLKTIGTASKSDFLTASVHDAGRLAAKRIVGIVCTGIQTAYAAERDCVGVCCARQVSLEVHPVTSLPHFVSLVASTKRPARGSPIRRILPATLLMGGYVDFAFNYLFCCRYGILLVRADLANGEVSFSTFASL